MILNYYKKVDIKGVICYTYITQGYAIDYLIGG